MTSKIYAVIAGVGPGTGAAVARKFAEAYSVVLLARSAENYESLVGEINGKGGSAIGISTDVSSVESVKNAFRVIDEKFGKDASCAAAIFNAGGKFVKKPFLEQTEEEFTGVFDVNCKGGFYFSQAVLPRLLKTAEQDYKHPPTLLFTGATASVRGSASFAGFAAGKFATRALAQSLAREFGPRGVHVGHVIVDGVIDIPRTKDWLQGAGPDAKISADSISETYWYLHTQPRSAFSQEIDIRPWVEKW
ncbi:hypothetical protein HYFRA_00001750 [Hymenoscyphus fraxineus]|uniref:NAD(P)-binding protein n=1 Tax=Hymenoscyphus fraxineus TaxID=746836 RepID=A0A9N9PU40_9HELO|nr:hypothetical protein HYFRA_00001750 [Hymenoscyphus fraxineus]